MYGTIRLGPNQPSWYPNWRQGHKKGAMMAAGGSVITIMTEATNKEQESNDCTNPLEG
jgi:hypothetical protein